MSELLSADASDTLCYHAHGKECFEHAEVHRTSLLVHRIVNYYDFIIIQKWLLIGPQFRDAVDYNFVAWECSLHCIGPMLSFTVV